jgi:hypothetical protein
VGFEPRIICSVGGRADHYATPLHFRVSYSWPGKRFTYVRSLDVHRKALSLLQETIVSLKPARVLMSRLCRTN